MLLVSPAAPLFPRHPAGLSSVEGHRQRVMELALQHHHAAAVLWELSNAPRLNFPTVPAMWEEGQHERGPHPCSIQSCSTPPPCLHIPFSLSVLTVALPACSPRSPSLEYSCSGLISPMETFVQ